MTVSQLIHIWANQSKPSGKSGNVFFEGPVLYSYGYYYPVGVFIEYKGRSYVLLNDADSSRTTNSHRHTARAAVNHHVSFNVLFDSRGLSSPSHPSFISSWVNEDMIKKTMDHYSDRLKKLQLSLKTTRKRHDMIIGDIDLCIRKANSFLETFREFAPKGIRKLKARSNKEIEAAIKKAQEAKKKEINRKRVAFEESLVDWKKGEKLYVEHRFDFPVHLRKRLTRRPVGSPDFTPIIETSHGAQVDEQEAIILYQRAMIFRKNPKLATRIAGAKVGHFTVTSMNDKGIKIGCHFITWDVIDEFAKEQGWITNEKASA